MQTIGDKSPYTKVLNNHLRIIQMLQFKKRLDPLQFGKFKINLYERYRTPFYDH